VTPEDLQDSRILRQTDLSLPEYEERGMKNFKNLYGETAENVQGLLDGAYPDMGMSTPPSPAFFTLNLFLFSII